MAEPVAPPVRPFRWADDVFVSTDPNDPIRDHEEWLRRRLFNTLVRESIPLPRFDVDVSSDFPPVLAEVNHGRWIARCPWCAGAEALWRGQDWFFCCSCGNYPIKGVRLHVKYGQPSDLVESALVVREDKRTQNWLPDETVDDLEQENEEHGHPIRPGRGKD